MRYHPFSMAVFLIIFSSSSFADSNSDREVLQVVCPICLSVIIDIEREDGVMLKGQGLREILQSERYSRKLSKILGSEAEKSRKRIIINQEIKKNIYPTSNEMTG